MNDSELPTPRPHDTAEGSCHRKVRYKTEISARAKSRYIFAVRQTRTRVYRCPFCYGYHLTHL